MNERDLFMAALQIEDPAERSASLDRACAGETALRRRVEALLAAFEQAGSFLQQPAGDSRATSDIPSSGGSSGSDPAESPGAVIGPYKLVELIGEGGMGSVYLARQSDPVKRLVALKVIKAGMDSRPVLARFGAERQALALMDHPNIAKVLDAGTTPEGRPYFVMELVKGVPITKFCDERKMSLRERLELFVPVCHAVQHAHQKGVIHRDIKPSNVPVALYDGKPVPKVIDFGVAKAIGQPLTEETLVTGLGTVVGTPEYMSPEQAEFDQLDVDTRSDVYSLGVLLYELLTGGPPFTRKELDRGLLEMLRTIREREPQRPSARLSTAEGLPALAADRGTEPARLRRLVRGELDWIVMKALEKDRNRRYESAVAFAADVHRYLAGEAVLAVPPSAGYRLRKFVRRNKGPVLAASLSLVALLGGGVGVGFGMTEAWKQREATALRQQAESARGDAVNAREGEEKARRKAEEAWGKLAGFEYGRTIQLALQEWRDNNVAGALALLASTRTDLRGWEYDYVHRLCHSEILRLPIHTPAAFAVSADGSRIVTGDPNVMAVVRDARTGAELLNIPLRFRQRPPTAKNGATARYALISVAFSPDASRIVTGGYDGMARVWDAKTGAELFAVGPDDSFYFVRSVMYSADGTRILTREAGTARVWDAKTGAAILSFGEHDESPPGRATSTPTRRRSARTGHGC